MNINKTAARTAGILYLLMGITGMLGILYIPSQIIVPDDATATAANILAHEFLYSLGIVCQLACQTIFVYLVLSLHSLFKEVNRHYALQMLVLVAVSVPIAFLILLNQLAALVLLSGAGFLSGLLPEQLNSLAMIFFKLYEHGIITVQIFWGLWLIPLGLLAYRSSFVPRFIGIFLVLGGIGYVIASLAGLLFPQYSGSVGPIVTFPSVIGEFSMIFWLLYTGLRSTTTADLKPSLS